MSTAGEAASLFGVVDSAADPFATVLGSDDADATIHATGDVPVHGQQALAASEIFGAGSEGTDWLGAGGEPASYAAGHTHEQGSWHNAGSQDSYSYGTADANSSMSTSSYLPQVDHYDPYGQGSGYGETQSQNPTAYGVPEQRPPVQHHDSYTPYAPPYSTVSSAQSNFTSNGAYDPYQPATQAAPNRYPPSQPAPPPVQSSYEPYQPARATTSQPDAVPLQPPHSHTNGSSVVWTPQIPRTAPAPPPPPVLAVAAAYRPKTSNAYDPPLPPPKHAKHAYTRQQSHPPPAPIVQLPHADPRPFSPLRNPPVNNVNHHHPTTLPTRDAYTAVSRTPDPQWTNGIGRSPPPPPPVNRGRAVDAPFTGGNSYTNGARHDDSHYEPRAAVNGDQNAGWNDPVSYDATESSSYQYSSDATSQHPRMISPSSHAAAVEGLPLPPTNHLDQAWTPPLAYSSAAVVEGPPRHASPLAASPASSYRADFSVSSPASSLVPARSDTYNLHRSPERAKSPWEAVSRPTSAAYPPSGHNGVDAYDPLITSRSLERTRSPGEASVRSASGIARQSFHPPSNEWSPSLPASPPMGPSGSGTVYSPPSSSYEPPSLIGAKRTTSPSPSIHSLTGSLSARHNPYSPSSLAAESTYPRVRSTSNGSAFSSASHEDPYAPSRHVRQQPSETSSQGSVPSLYERPPPVLHAHVIRAPTTYDRTGAQILTLAPPVHPTYAPSPSLLGTNDPLGRTSARIPVFSFGFGGKIATCFHGSSALNTGFDVALSSRASTDIKLYVLHKVIPESTLETSTSSFPGPLFSDPGPPSTSLVRTGAATQTKTKKASVIKYLQERADEMSRGLGYFHSGSLDGRRAEAKYILVLLLKVMVGNDGKLSGSPEIDETVRAALVPRLGLQKTSPDTVKSTSSLSISHMTEAQSPLSDLPPTSSYAVLGAPVQDPNDSPVTVHTLRASHLDKIQDFLLRGDRHAACHYASDEKLWAHAMVIASSIDKAAWKEVVTEFVRTELVAKDTRNGLLPRAQENKSLPSHGREALRVAYSHYAGQGPASVQELLPPKPLTAHLSAQTLQLPPPSMSSITPISPNFPTLAEMMKIPPEVLSKWADTAAMIVSSPMTVDSSSTLTALGDQLSGNQWFEAAHACYLLAPQTSPMGGVGSASRLILVGSPSPSTLPTFVKDQDPFIFSEIAEFALSLATPTKGQEAFGGLPHLQPYRLIRAAWLAEMGHVQLANRYCDAITGSLGRNSPYINNTFIEQLKGLSDRLIAAPQDKSGSWIGSKMAKPSLDSIGSWLEGRFTKFIAGEGDSPLRGPEDPAATPHQPAFTGPFAHYSTISSGASSAIPSPRQSQTDLTETSSPPFRTGSAMALRSSATSQVQINRASSAMDYTRAFDRKASPIPRVSSASATTSTFADASLYSQALNGHAFGSSSKQRIDEVDVNEDGAESALQSQGPRTTWWGSPESGAPTPTASSFMRIGDSESAESSGFISLMDDTSLSATPVASRAPSSVDNRGSVHSSFGDDDDDDLGLGNSSRRTASTDETTTEHTNGDARPEAKPAEALKKPELKSTESGSWFTRIWKRESTPAPVKANLGEQTSFYYDKELKRWVNKSSGNEAAASSPPPPPPRAQTASPGRSFGTMPAGTPPPHPPPARPSTALDLTQPPRKPPMRVRSNLVPPESENTSAPPTPASATTPLNPRDGLPPPPPGGRKVTQGKRAVRNRYVDIFQQEVQGGST